VNQTIAENQPCEAIVGQWQSFDCHHHGNDSNSSPKLELADVFLLFWEDCLNRFNTSSAQRRFESNITKCRTPAMGGHLERCNHCGDEREVYKSCCDRHCPKCGLVNRAEWREKRQAETMPIDYYHVVYKVPGLEGIARDNPELMLDLMLWAAAEALKTIAANPKYLGGKIGLYQQLHTSSEMLEFHPHVDCLVSSGGLSPDGQSWVSCKEGFLPKGILTARFRRLVLNGLKKLFKAGKLQFFGEQAHLNDAAAFGRHLAKAKAKNWNVYVERPIGRPEQVLDYMNRHAQSVAIANDRLQYIKDGRVYFQWKDYRVGDKLVTTSLSGVEFIRRVLMHVLPKGFKAMRPGGFLANCHKKVKLAQCFRLLGVRLPELGAGTKRKKGYRERYEELTGRSLSLCTKCWRGEMVVVVKLAKVIKPPQEAVNSS
jgi:Putative transposase/Transposase zinc-binding domain